MHTMETLLKEFGDKLGVNALSFDEDQFCMLHIDDESVVLHWQRHTDTLLLYTVLFQWDDRDYNLNVLQLVAEANLFGGIAPNTHIGLHPDTRAFVLSCSTPVSALSLDALEALLGHIADTAMVWRPRIEALAHADETLASCVGDSNAAGSGDSTAPSGASAPGGASGATGATGAMIRC